MPLLVTDYSWKQTETSVFIHVPLKGVKVGTVDIICTDEYLKVHFPPYLFEAFLLEPVDDDRSAAKVGNGLAIITLPKKSNNFWNNLMITTSDKEKKKEIRERALVKYQEKLLSDSKSRLEKQNAEKKYALQTMMKLEQEERENIQTVKDTERRRTTAELETWQLSQKKNTEEEEETKVQNRGKTTTTQTRGSDITQDGRREEVKRKKKMVELAAPRSAGNIQVSFTPRVFPTALRESRVHEEEEWLRKQAEARRATAADVEELNDLKEEDRNPDWLKDKGDKYFATGDFLSAVSAYNLAIKLNGKLPALYSNRAACHLKLRNLHKAVEDSSQALELLTPPVDANAAARSRAHVRRGSAFCQLELYTEGLQDFQAALRIHPHDEKLQEDERRIRDIVQGTA